MYPSYERNVPGEAKRALYSKPLSYTKEETDTIGRRWKATRKSTTIFMGDDSVRVLRLITNMHLPLLLWISPELLFYSDKSTERNNMTVSHFPVLNERTW